MKIIIAIFLSMIAVPMILLGQQVVSNKGDQMDIADIQIEPWYIQNSAIKAKLNTDAIFQNGKVAVGAALATQAMVSQLEVLGGSSAQLGLTQSLKGTKWDLSSESGGFTFTQRRPINNRSVEFYNNGSVAFGSYIFNSNSNPRLPSVGFYFNGVNNRLKIGNTSDSNTGATQSLDVQDNVRIRNLTPINSDALQVQYNKDLVADANGNLAYVDSKSSTSFWSFVTFKSTKMTAAVPSTKADGFERLNNMTIPLTVPPFTTMQVKIEYNVPVMHLDRSISYLGYGLFKRVNGGNNQELPMGSRKYTALGGYKSGYSAASTSVFGIPIRGTAVDVIANDTATAIQVEYEVYGYVEGNGGTVTFGMYSTNGDNVNWGKGAMCLEIYSKPNGG